MTKDLSKLWVEKYRPQTLDEYIFQDPAHEKAFRNMVAEGSIPHLLLSGVQGTGKTTMSNILVNELNLDTTDILRINASDETGVDAMRDKIKSFISTFAIGSFKVVQLEEADYLSKNAQAVLRQMLEEYADAARFILTCNYSHKIIPAIQSRVQHYHFATFSEETVTEHVALILAKEKVRLETDEDFDLLDKFIAAGAPDIRKIINLIQQNVVDGKLQPMSDYHGDWKFRLLELLNVDDWGSIRQLLCGKVDSYGWEEVYQFLYNNLKKSQKFRDQSKWEEGIVIVAEFLYKHSMVADPEINAAAMFIRLSQV